MSKPNQAADINEKRAARGKPALTVQEMCAALHRSYGDAPWPGDWADKLINDTMASVAEKA